jgi:phage replication O-like protein O
MANPQVENGHVKIANEIVEQLARINLSNYEWRILMVILRKTYGWNKKTDNISLSQFEDSTGIKSQHIAVALKRLVKSNVITKHNGSKVMEYGLQKDYSKWLNKQQPLLKQVVPIQVVPNGVVPEMVVPIQVVHATPSGSTDSGSPLVPIQVVPATLTASTDSGSNKRQYKDNITKDIVLSNIYNSYETNMGQTLTPAISEELKLLAIEYPEEWFTEAVKIAVNNQKRSLYYVKGILKRWKIEGFKSNIINPPNKQNTGYKINPNQYSDVRDYGKYGTTPTP